MDYKTEGICIYCKKSFAGNAITRHLSLCEDRKKVNNTDIGNEKIFLIKSGAGLFGVYVEVNASDSLKEIDNFLRNLWLECCGHLSAFHIGEMTYASSPDKSYDDRSMNIAVGKALIPGMSFSHEYDFGTTTELGLKCLSQRIGKKLEKIEILARNKMPDFKCKCGQLAKEICTECLWERGPEAMLCKKCAKEHECDEEIFLPVVNSPRMGMCGYTGHGDEEKIIKDTLR